MDMLPGVFLRETRLRLRLGVRDIQKMSSKIAKRERNRRFYISPARLSQIESGIAIPSQFKIFTIAAIYGLSFYEILARYGVDPDRTHAHRAQVQVPATHPISAELHSFGTKISIPIRLDPSFKWEQTNLVNRVVAMWGEIPAALLLRCNPKAHMYAYIGTRDDTMGPLLRPGSVVMVDGAIRRVAAGGWKNEYDRPIYFVELRDGYVCSWCQVVGSRLITVPHPNSEAPVRTFDLGKEAEVIGRVVGVTMRLVPVSSSCMAEPVTSRTGYSVWTEVSAGPATPAPNQAGARI